MIPAYKRGVALRGTESVFDNELLDSLAESSRILKEKANATYKSAEIKAKKYSKSKLKNVGKTQQELDAEAESEESEEAKKKRKKDEEDQAAFARDASSSAKGLSEDSDGGSIFAMLFKIVPIGLNIVRRLPNVGRGLKNIAQGFGEEVVGLASTAARIIPHSIEWTIYFGQYIFSLIVCSIFKIFTLHKCIPFYIVDIFLFVLYIAFFSVCFMLDIILFIPYLFGFGLVDALGLILSTIDEVDRTIYTASGIHIFGYPDWIVKMCYRCDLMGDTSDFERTGGNLKYDITKYFPRKVLDPLGKMAGGLGDIFSIFNISS